MSRRNSHFLVLALILAGLTFAWLTRHVQDDAYITFRYSQNLVEGHGPVYNPGEHVEGYSNFLWMLIMAIPISMGLDPVIPSLLLGLLCLGLNLWLCYRLFSRVLKSHHQGFVVFLLLLTNDALLGFGTSGLETAMNALLWTGLLALSLDILSRPPRSIPLKTWMATGLVAALCVLSRPDGALIVAVCGGFLLRYVVVDKSLGFRPVWIAASTFFAIVLAWLIWKWSFYGDLLPNTFYAKSGPYLRDGILFVGAFFLTYGLFLPFGIALGKARSILAGMNASKALLWVLLVVWSLYLVWIGGDFMFFRMWVPVLSAVYMLVGEVVFRQMRQVRWQYAVVGILLLTNLLHIPGFGRWYESGFVLPLNRWSVHTAGYLPYAEQGKVLKELFGEVEPPLRMSVGAAGASPYYSGLWTTDIYGLTDPVTAHDGIRNNMNPGHRTLASFARLRELNVNLWIYRCDHRDSLPDVESAIKTDRIVQAMRPQDAFVNGRMWIVSIPVRETFVMSCLYPIPHPAVDAKIQQGDFQLFEVFFKPE